MTKFKSNFLQKINKDKKTDEINEKLKYAH